MDSEGKKTEPYYPDGGYGWVIVGAIILINVSIFFDTFINDIDAEGQFEY